MFGRKLRSKFNTLNHFCNPHNHRLWSNKIAKNTTVLQYTSINLQGQQQFDIMKTDSNQSNFEGKIMGKNYLLMKQAFLKMIKATKYSKLFIFMSRLIFVYTLHGIVNHEFQSCKENLVENHIASRMYNLKQDVHTLHMQISRSSAHRRRLVLQSKQPQNMWTVEQSNADGFCCSIWSK